MRKQEYDQFIKDLTENRTGISSAKRKDYTRGDKDVLKNFKQVAEYTGLDPLEVWMVYASKHWDSICSYIKNGTESEPIRERYCDLLNYLELGYALIKEQQNEYTQINSSISSDSNLVGIDGAYDE